MMDTFEKSALLSILLGEICLVFILLFGFNFHRMKIEELKEQLKAIQIEKVIIECNCNKEIKDGDL